MTETEDCFGELTPEHQAIYEKFRSEIKDLIRPSFDNYFVWKWIKATNYDIEKAKERFMKHLQFRKRYGIDTILDDFKLPEISINHYSYAVMGFDKNGDIITVDFTAFCDFRGLCRSLTHTQQVKIFCFLLETLLQMVKEENEKSGFRVRKLVSIVNMKDQKMKHFLDSAVRRAFIETADILSMHYPELLKRTYVINAPCVFYAWYKFFKNFLDPVVAEKFQLFASDGWLEALQEHIDLDIIPAFMGGNRTDPDGNPDCITLLKRGTEVPASYYLTNNIIRVKDDPLAKKVTVRERAYYNQSVYVKEKNSTISWSFETVDHNIRFGIYYVPFGVKPMPATTVPRVGRSLPHRTRKNSREGHIIIIPIEPVESQHVPETGEFVCEEAGTYLLHFDNTYSWTRSKALYLKIQVVPPTALDSTNGMKES